MRVLIIRLAINTYVWPTRMKRTIHCVARSVDLLIARVMVPTDEHVLQLVVLATSDNRVNVSGRRACVHGAVCHIKIDRRSWQRLRVGYQFYAPTTSLR
jgi:hypothetical protein